MELIYQFCVGTLVIAAVHTCRWNLKQLKLERITHNTDWYVVKAKFWYVVKAKLWFILIYMWKNMLSALSQVNQRYPWNAGI